MLTVLLLYSGLVNIIHGKFIELPTRALSRSGSDV